MTGRDGQTVKPARAERLTRLQWLLPGIGLVGWFVLLVAGAGDFFRHEPERLAGLLVRLARP